MHVTYRPYRVWPGRVYDAPGRSPFTASWASTLDDLDREVHQLQSDDRAWRADRLGEPVEVTIELDIPTKALRRDGGLLADARVGYHGVVISFDSRHGELRYLCDRYAVAAWARGALEPWKANVRAIVLSLEALRSVDRHGVTTAGEQYAGFKALDAPSATLDAQSEAAMFLARHSGMSMFDLNPPVPGAVTAAYRAAARRLHPDVGGDPALFRRLIEARDLLETR
jgi:hypothetical protein